MDITDAKALLHRRHARPGKVFLELIERDGRVVAPGCHCAMDAAIVAKIAAEFAAEDRPCQFNAVYGSGWSASAMLRYQPDMGIHDRNSIVATAKGLVEGAWPLPVVMDAEAGFGPRAAVPEIVRDYAAAGVAVLHLEDQNPDLRRCGHLGGKVVDDLENFLAKLRLALLTLDAIGSDMLLMARTDAHDAANGSPEEAIRRGKAFADLRVGGCGRRVDLIWCEFATPDPGLAREFAAELRRHDPTVRLAINFSPNMDQAAWFRKHGVDPATYEQYAEMGYLLQFHTVWSAKVQMQAMYDWTRRMGERGAHGLYEFQDQLRGHPTASGQTMSRAKEYQDLDMLLGGDEAAKRYGGSRGFGSTGAGGIHDVDASAAPDDGPEKLS